VIDVRELEVRCLHCGAVQDWDRTPFVERDNVRWAFFYCRDCGWSMKIETETLEHKKIQSWLHGG
jgi:transcription elongation factor Elf1